MKTKHFLSHLAPGKREKLGEVVRFGIIGAIATAIQCGVYLGSMPVLAHFFPQIGTHTVATIANTIAYIMSFLFNFWGSTHYTFKVEASAKHGVGFTLSHIINYLLQTLCLNFFMSLGLSKEMAMIPMFCICIPTNFVLVRFFLKK